MHYVEDVSSGYKDTGNKCVFIVRIKMCNKIIPKKVVKLWFYSIYSKA